MSMIRPLLFIYVLIMAYIFIKIMQRLLYNLDRSQKRCKKCRYCAIKSRNFEQI